MQTLMYEMNIGLGDGLSSFQRQAITCTNENMPNVSIIAETVTFSR